MYVGWLLSEPERQRLLALFEPRYPDVVAHHVTLAFGVGEDHPLPSETQGFVAGIADDNKGVQALVIEIGGTTARPDGSTYHITWSLDRAAGAKPVDSNRVIRDLGYERVPQVPVRLIPKWFSK